MLGLEEKDVSLCLKDYQFWRGQFEEEKIKLAMLLNNICVAIEHVGSTAIPGVAAKPIIDIAVGVAVMESDGERCKDILCANGYIFKAENGGVGRMFFMRVVDSKRTHHIHVELYGGEAWNNHINFRDTLCKDVSMRRQYVLLKQYLAEEYPHDRSTYTAKKASFIQRVLSQV